MEAFFGWHGTLGLAVVVLNILVGVILIKARKEQLAIAGGFRFLAYVGQILLLVQVLIGLDLWARGARPAPGVWGWLHLLLPIGALLFSVMMLIRMRKKPKQEHATDLSKAAWHTASVAVLTYLIGTLG